MKRVTRWILRGLLIALLLLVLAGVGAWIWQRGSLATLEGELKLKGLAAPVEVRFDANAIPTIKAENEADALFALGFLHAQERLFQMDFTRRLGAGRLSEVAGAATLRLDKVMRTLGLRQVAEANLAALSPAGRAALEAYSAGVNAYISQHEGPWPAEFYALSYDPEPWTPADSLVWGRLMALQLSGNYSEEILRARLAQTLSPEELKQLYPAYPADAPIATQDLAALDQRGVLRDLANALPWDLGPKDASNTWSVSAARSSTGGVLLANDPHLSLQAPGYWYLARIETPEMTLAGATAPGVPYIVIGHNATLAWSFTTTHSDTQDLFIETVDPNDPDSYLTREGPRPFKTRQEVIRIAGGEAETITVRETYHGPVMSDAVEDTKALLGAGKVLALAWPALLQDDRSGDALYKLNRAESVQQGLAALRDLGAPQQTMILADTQGHMTLVAPGRVPIRAAGNGLLPVEGADGKHDWVGWIPYEDLPRLADPPSGLLVAANNKQVPDDYPYLIAAEWNLASRAQRIAEVLKGQQTWSPDDMRRLQMDSLSIGARALLPRLLPAVEGKPEAEAALALLRDWDFVMDRDKAAPLIYSAWVRALERRLLADQVPAELLANLLVGDETRLRGLLEPGSLYCDDKATATVEDCDAMIALALDEALAELVRLYGEEPAKWRWGKAHTAIFEHPVFGYIPIVEGMTSYEVETDGGQDTVNRGGSNFAAPAPEAYRHRHGPTLRVVYDLADLDRSTFTIATGQSGNLLSEHYGDFAQRWADGDAVVLVGGATDGGTLLRLTPAP